MFPPQRRQRKTQKRPNRTQNQLQNPRVPRAMFGAASVMPRVNGVRLSYETNDLLNQSTLANPFNFSYFNLTNPLISNGGAATAVPYFTAWSGMYRKYRVRKFSIVARFQNSETYGVIPFLCPLNFLPTSTVANNAAYVKNILTKKKISGGIAGMNVTALSVTHTVAEMSGFANSDVEDAYVGLTDGSASPSDNIYAVVGTDNNGAASVSGVLASVKVTFWIDFIERQTPAN